MNPTVMRYGAIVLASQLCSLSAAARETPPDWPDTLLARTQALVELQSLNADLLSHPSATLTLERWCRQHRLAGEARIVAHRLQGEDKPLPEGARTLLQIGPDEPVRYRRVQLACGDRVLSDADNWYVPSRLTTAMNEQLDHSDEPFGKVVQPLHFRRQTLSADLLWSPLPDGWDGQPPQLPADGHGPLQIPHQLLQHRAVLFTGENRPFSMVVETYTDQVLAFPPPEPR